MAPDELVSVVYCILLALNFDPASFELDQGFFASTPDAAQGIRPFR